MSGTILALHHLPGNKRCQEPFSPSTIFRSLGSPHDHGTLLKCGSVVNTKVPDTFVDPGRLATSGIVGQGHGVGILTLDADE